MNISKAATFQLLLISTLPRPTVKNLTGKRTAGQGPIDHGRSRFWPAALTMDI